MTATLESASATQLDVIDLLLAQHDQIRAAVAVVAAARGPERDAAVRAMATLIETHEDVEAQLVHPLAEQGLPNGAAMAHARVVEENRADELLGRLVSAGAADARFPAVFAEFRAVLLDHLCREEQEEFVALRARFSAGYLIEVGVRARENRTWL